MATAARMQAYERLGALGQQLVPGIPDEIALDHIVPKLGWRDINVLSVVSRVWLHAIRTHLVHEARVRSDSIDTLFLVKFVDSDGLYKIVFFDLREKYVWLEKIRCVVPPIPNLEGRFPRLCKLVSVDGKLFVLGGKVEPKDGHDSTDKVYVLDLAGRSQWKQCAGMKSSRTHFGCGLLNGKIYVFGGLSSGQPVLGSEVYDTDKNTWSPIEPMISSQYEQRVRIVGTELSEYDGKNLDGEIFSALVL